MSFASCNPRSGSLSLHHPSSEYGQVCFSLNGGLLLNSNWFACQTSQKTRIHLQPISELAFSLPPALYRPPSSFPCNAEYVMAENQTTDFAATDIPLNSLPHPQLARPGRDPDRSLQQDLENGIGDRTCEDRILPNGYRRSQEMSPDDELEGRNREEVIPHQILPWMRRPGRSTEHLRKCGAICTWIRGPEVPRISRINPFFPNIQRAPIRLLDRWLPGRKWKFGVLSIFCALWIVSFSLTLHQSVMGPVLPGNEPTAQLSCIASLWPNGTDCGLDGDLCRPFNASSFAFRCPAYCSRVKAFEPYAVGADEILYKTIVIGGHSDKEYPIYRGDSFICPAALHAGIISDKTGGCGLLSRLGEQSNYPGTKANGVSSTAFPSYFPLSFTFEKLSDGADSQCQDLRWHLLALSVAFTSLLSLFTASGAVFFTCSFAGIFFHVALVSDTPESYSFSSVVSIALARFLPAGFVAFAIYYFWARITLRNLDAQVEKTILWLGGCWVGALHNYTLDRIPLSRLTPHDLKQQPGAIFGLLILVLVIAAIALVQAWVLRTEGRLLNFLKLYALIGSVLLILLAIPHMHLRLHHYIIALLLLPGTATQTRPTLLYQGFLVGLFINGVARWGFASILETSIELLSNAQMNSPLPYIPEPTITNNSITFSFSNLTAGFGGISVLVNDVERYRSYESYNKKSFTWRRHPEVTLEFFRFGYIFRDAFGNSWFGDFTKAGTWKEDGSWQHMKPGPSR
uniref:LCCL domain-containing protein n=1 Tax=Coccidioides posadasii RMSCC 3488 TaxID=454284 RepID=A0A0J6FQR1_COCPO|nr:LCCL domain-containing protein [Coccidioides posadasii RMSCC 3488]